VASTAGAYVLVDGQTYRVLGLTLDKVTAQIKAAVEDGSVVSLDVVAPRSHAEGQGAGTLFLRGDRLSSIAVLAGPQSVGGHPATS
jgi:hypothetical protein